MHRDVTPDNVMLANTGEVKLIDFGVAKATKRDDGLTQRGVIGKADWLAPELFHGAKLNRRADIYTLGLLYWYILTRREPGSTKANRTVSSDRFVPPSAFNPEVSHELDQVVARATDPDPNLRFQTAAELARAAGRHVPEGFAGKAAVANLIFRNTSRLAGNLLSKLLEEGRPLLDDAPVLAPPPQVIVAGDTVAESRRVYQSQTEPRPSEQARPRGATSAHRAGSVSEEKRSGRAAQPDGRRERSMDTSSVPPPTSDEIVPIPRRNWRRVIVLAFGASAAVSFALFVAFSRGSSVNPPITRPMPQPSLVATPPVATAPSPLLLPPVVAPPSLPSASLPSPERGVSVTARTPTSATGKAVRPHPMIEPRSPPVRSAVPGQPRQGGDALLEEARTQLGYGNFAEALRLARLAAPAGGGATAHILAGRLLLKMQDLKAAEMEFTKALADDAKNREARELLARTRESIANP